MKRVVAILALLLSARCEERVAPKGFDIVAEMASRRAATFELVTLSPFVDNDRGLQGWKVLGSSPISRQTARTLIDRLAASVEPSPKDWAACFNPRHAIRVRDGEQWADAIICFECGQIYVHHGRGRTKFPMEHVVLARDEQRLFNDAARRHHLKVEEVKRR